ncbi:hypothetical protein Tco_0893181 [Tanacetum coccineum]|uniref:Reverse transcriptase domain-containing protein n=1 Tax=Tanacetum coccineum TaxID=301880 RepID=A0ABQ5CE88_9ASTR
MRYRTLPRPCKGIKSSLDVSGQTNTGLRKNTSELLIIEDKSGYRLGDKGLSSEATKLNSIFITTERRQNKGLQAFMDRFKSESSHIKGVPPVLRISDFMHGHGHSKLAKKLNNKIPKTVDEMIERVRAFIRGEVVVGSAEMGQGSQHQRLLSVKKVNSRSCGLRKVSPSGERYPSNQSKERKPRKEQCKAHKHDKRRRKSQKGIVMMETSREALWECRQPERMQDSRKEHQLKIYPFAKPVIHKRRSMTPDIRLVLKEEEFRWLKERMIRKPQQSLSFVQRLVPVLRNGIRLSIDNGNYSYKMFHRESEGYTSIIRNEEDDEEKTGFHTEEGVYYFTDMPKELKKLSSYTSYDDGEGLSRSKRMERGNILERNSNKKQKVKEGRFLGFMVTQEGVRSDPEKVKVITDGPMEEILKLSEKEGRLAKWTTEIRTYDISYIPKREAEGSVVKKFFGQEEQEEETSDANE